MQPSQYSLEQRLVEPFRAIRSLRVSILTVILSIFALIFFAYAWWHFRDIVFNFWTDFLDFLISATGQSWRMSSGFWPEFAKPIMTLPKLSASIPPPSAFLWWSFAISSIALYLFSGTWRSAFLPLRATTRFILFLLWISLACFGIAPTQFQHSVEEWSKIYFLGAFGSVIIYSIIWTCGVLWFPIRTWVKLALTCLLFLYFMVGTPLLLFLCTLLLHYASLLMLPLLALAFAPLLQLGWFVAFYSLALSSGVDPKQEISFE